MLIDIVIFDGFDELDALGPFEVLKNAAEAGAGFDVRLVAWPDHRAVVAAHGLSIEPDAATSAARRPDLVIVPGGGWVARNATGARAEAERGEIPARLAKMREGGTTIAAVCTGAMLLASADLLRGRAATTHHAAIDELRAAGAEVIAARVVDDGDLLTSGGVTSGLDLALWLVERFAGPQLALAVEREMEYERRGIVWRRQSN